MLDRSFVEAAVVETISPFIGVGVGQTTSGSSLYEDLGIDSGRFVEIILKIEDRFNISIDDNSLDRLRTVGDLVDYVMEHSSSYNIQG